MNRSALAALTTLGRTTIVVVGAVWYCVAAFIVVAVLYDLLYFGQGPCREMGCGDLPELPFYVILPLCGVPVAGFILYTVVAVRWVLRRHNSAG
jgi:hypothetical protein